MLNSTYSINRPWKVGIPPLPSGEISAHLVAVKENSDTKTPYNIKLSDQARQLKQTYEKKEDKLELKHNVEKQQIETEYRQEKQRLDNEYDKKLKALSIDTYI